jgi:carbamoyltransferase
MTAILGISAFYHDSAAALVVDGDIVAAAQEERFTRKKHDFRFPTHAVQFCLKQAGLSPEDLDWVGFYDKPLMKFERLLETYLAYAPWGFRSFVMSMPLWLREKLFLPRIMRQELGGHYQRRFVFTEHHESHAASAFFPSPFEEAAILTLDGVGEWATASFGTGRGNRIELSHELRFPHSLGLLYTAFTYYTGFRVNSGEYKVMGLAPYGEPKYVDQILEHLIDLKPDGSFRMDMSYFNYCQGLTMTSAKFHKLFDAPPRKPESRITQREMDLAASVQEVTEEVMLRIARHVHQVTGQKNLCMAGGVALNCVGNGRILREGPFENIWIQPAAGDAGGALGVALFTLYQLLDNPREPHVNDHQHGSLLGPRYTDESIERFLKSVDAKYTRYEDADAMCNAVAELLSQEKVVGWFQDRMEFGPRALGARSILGDSRSPEMQTVMNLKIKFRESFRPFAPSILRNRVDDYFEMRPEEDSPYMLLVAPVQVNKRLDNQDQHQDLEGIEKLKIPRSEVPAITHVDYSARVQTVDEQRNPRYHRLLQAFEQKTGCPVMINTSFNVRGEPIVCTPEDAYRCFLATNMDVLALENFVLEKQNQQELSQQQVDQYLADFALD